MPQWLIPLHPKLVHFPIALFVMALSFEVISICRRKEIWHQAALLLYVSASLIAPVVVITGLWEAERLHLRHPLLYQHKAYALWVMWISLASLPLLWVCQRIVAKYFRFIFLTFLIGVVVLTCFAAHSGGRLVYEYGIGVQP